MTPRQRRFVNEYLVDLNATRAMIRAGYAPEWARQNGHHMLRRPDIKAAVDAALNAIAERTTVTKERVVLELARIGMANMGEYIRTQPDGTAYVDLSQLTADQAAAIQEITTKTYLDGNDDDARPIQEVRLKLHPRTPALKLLGQHLGMKLADKVEVNAHVHGTLQHSFVSLEYATVEEKLQLLEISERIAKRQEAAQQAARQKALSTHAGRDHTGTQDIVDVEHEQVG